MIQIVASSLNTKNQSPPKKKFIFRLIPEEEMLKKTIICLKEYSGDLREVRKKQSNDSSFEIKTTPFWCRFFAGGGNRGLILTF